MRRISAQLLCQIYLLLLLLAATIMSPLPYLLLAVALLLMGLFITIRPRSPGFNIVVNIAIIFLTPLILAPPLESIATIPVLVTQILAVILVLPAIYLLDHNLRENARHIQVFVKVKGDRRTTYTFVSLLISVLVLLLISPVVNSPTLLFTGIAFALYLLGVLIAILITIPRLPFTTTVITKRVIADTTGSTPLYVTSKAKVKLRSHVSPTVSWVRVTSSQTATAGDRIRLDVSFTPPLSGQSRPQLLVSAVDPRGFIQINQLLEPLELNVIPRAKYAEWLAKKYLEQTGTGLITAANLPPQAIMIPRRGIEYQESRTYQPGDPLKDVDWKHTLKLSQLIVREYHEAGEQAAIIAVNLAVTDAEAADKLAFNLLTVALTLARENIPTALAVYNHQNVILSTAIIEPLEMLRQALSLVRAITLIKFADRYLEPIDIAKIRRNINQLKQTDSEPAQRLLDILNFEHRSIEEVARDNPATLALSAATKKVPAPAMILLVSQLNHDAEALLVTAEKLARRKFTTVAVEAS